MSDSRGDWQLTRRHSSKQPVDVAGSTAHSSWSRILSFLSHLSIIIVFFTVGRLHGSKLFDKNNDSHNEATATLFKDNSNCPLDGEAMTRKVPITDYYTTTTTTSSNIISSSKTPSDTPSAVVSGIHIHKDLSSYLAGMARIPRMKFLQQFDTGLPVEASTAGNSEILLLYDHKKSLPDNHHSESFPLYTDLYKALEHCQQVRVISMDPTQNSKTCLALQSHVSEPHPLVYKWKRRTKQQSTRKDHQSSFDYTLQTRLPAPPKPVVVQQAQKSLQSYLKHLPEALRQLQDVIRPMAKNVATKDESNTIIVMVVTLGHLPLFLNFLCASRRNNVQGLSERLLVWAMDANTKQHVEALGVSVFDGSLVMGSSFNNHASILHQGDYGSIEYAQIMMHKVYAVHALNRLGYNVLYHDVDMVPYREQYLDYLLKVMLQTYPDFDIYMQDDHANHDKKYAPYGGNSGLYYIACNAKTKYFLSRLVRSGELILKTKSHQATMSMVMADMASQYDLSVKILSSESHKFPLGYHFHRDWKYMKDMMIGRVKPYLFHMNWNQNSQTKREFLQQMGAWFVQDVCATEDDVAARKDALSFSDCCSVDPIIRCYYSDKPSKLPDCKSYPAIETNVSFW
jgi:hypothetical protein